MPKLSKMQQTFELFNTAYQNDELPSLTRRLNNFPPEQVAHLLETSPPKLREAIWDMLDPSLYGHVITELSEDLRYEYISMLGVNQLATLATDLDSDDIADILQQFPEKVINRVLEAMDENNRSRVEQVISYAEDTAGGLMNTDTICVRPRLSIDIVQRYLRLLGSLPPITDYLFVTNRNNKFVGILPLIKVLVSSPESTVRELMITDVKTINADVPEQEVALLFERHGWIAAPVINDEGELIGRITIDDVVDVIRDEADHSFMSMAGLDEESDTFSPAIKTAADRAIWLGINLLTAFVAASTIKLFEGTIEKVVALAVLMPIVAGMGGVAGSQTLTIVIRGMALGQIGSHNRSWLLQREFVVGCLNGMLWALVTGAITALWFSDLKLAVIIGVAMLINLATAALSGTLLPIIFKKFNIDPALASSMALTTVTDVVGFLSFLGLATYFYA